MTFKSAYLLDHVQALAKYCTESSIFLFIACKVQLAQTYIHLPGGASAPRPSARGRKIFPGSALRPVLRPARTPGLH
jgi:hypothetical protein